MSLIAQRQLTRIGVVQQRSGTLVQHVRIDATRPQEEPAALPHRASSPEPGQVHHSAAAIGFFTSSCFAASHDRRNRRSD